MKYSLVIGILLVSMLSMAAKGCDEQGEIWVANRGDMTVAVIDVMTSEVVDTIKLPEDGEPMYISSDKKSGLVFVGDRANDRVIAYSAVDREVKGTAPVGAGVFHMWLDSKRSRLWVNADVDKHTTIIDTKTLEVIAKVAMPAKLLEMGGKPHDVFVDPHNGNGFISYLGFEGDNDYVASFDGRNFELTALAPVGKDPHLFASKKHKALFVPCQGTDQVIVLNRKTLEVIADVHVPGAHGVFLSPDAKYLYTTNLPGGGEEAIFTLDTATYSLASDIGVDTPVKDGSPHNIALTDNGKMMYVTHSGPTATSVSVFSLMDSEIPEAVTFITTGANPFGLAFVQP